MTKEKLKNVLEAHKRYLVGDRGGKRADLRGAYLRGADLREADLRGVNLGGADLHEANLSGANGLTSAIDFMAEKFEKTDKGYLAYKTFNTMYEAPPEWKIKAGSVISENVQFDRGNDCGCGINVATYEWVRDHCDYRKRDIWKVLIRWEWLPGVCVPYSSDGKIRCERVELLEVVK